MDDQSELHNGRLLIVDDNPAIHEDFTKILAPESRLEDEMSRAELLLFGEQPSAPAQPAYELHFAHQGRQSAAIVAAALSANRPYALAFVHMRMPPGWDGLETIEQLWKVDPDLQVVICSAHSDYDWNDVIERLGHSDKLLVL